MSILFMVLSYSLKYLWSRLRFFAYDLEWTWFYSSVTKTDHFEKQWNHIQIHSLLREFHTVMCIPTDSTPQVLFLPLFHIITLCMHFSTHIQGEWHPNFRIISEQPKKPYTYYPQFLCLHQYHSYWYIEHSMSDPFPKCKVFYMP